MKQLTCFNCNKVVCNATIPDDAVLRAVLLCPECYAAEHGIEMETKE